MYSFFITTGKKFNFTSLFYPKHSVKIKTTTNNTKKISIGRVTREGSPPAAWDAQLY